jgi:hypothetical protein
MKKNCVYPTANTHKVTWCQSRDVVEATAGENSLAKKVPEAKKHGQLPNNRVP